MTIFPTFVSMKFIHILFLLTLVVLLTACPRVQYEDAKKKLYKNHMDLPDPEINYYSGIRFKLSNLFTDAYNKDYVLKDDALTRVIYDLDLNFSIEEFDASEAQAFQFAFSENTDLLNAVHDHYSFKRQNSLEEHFTSIKKSVPKTVGFNGVIQTIEDTEDLDEENLLYIMSTVEIRNKYYVFQLIGKKDNMGYLYDDFLNILNSIDK